MNELQRQVLQELASKLPYMPVGPDGRTDRRAINAACAVAAAKLKQHGMHPRQAMRVCRDASAKAPRVPVTVG